jgi:hypothetical protein
MKDIPNYICMAPSDDKRGMIIPSKVRGRKKKDTAKLTEQKYEECRGLNRYLGCISHVS